MFIDYDFLSNGEVHWFDHFEYQNSIYKMICNSVVDSAGIQKNIFTKINAKEIILEGEISKVQKDDGLIYYTGKKNAKIILKYELTETPTNFNLYFAEKNYNESVLYTINNKPIENSYWNKGIKPVLIANNGSYELEMILKDDITDCYIRDEFYYEDLDILKEYYNTTGVVSRILKQIWG